MTWRHGASGRRAHSMVDFIQYDLPEWNAGTEELSFDCEAVYRKLCDFFYLLDGHLKDDDQHNARRLKLSTRKFRSLKNDLIAYGKISIENGYIWNDRCERSLEKMQKKSSFAREKAKKRWGNRDAKPLKTNGSAHATAYAAGDANLETNKLIETSLIEGRHPPCSLDEQEDADFEKKRDALLTEMRQNGIG